MTVFPPKRLALRLATTALAAALASACTQFPPQGRGGAAEVSTTAGDPTAAYWNGDPIHADLRAEAQALKTPDNYLGERWVIPRLETMSCLDFKLEGLGQAGAGELFPADVALARADRRRALREFMGGLPLDGDLSLGRYREHVLVLESRLLRARRDVAAEFRDLRC